MATAVLVRIGNIVLSNMDDGGPGLAAGGVDILWALNLENKLA
jgi:hypothetical protein